MSATFASLRVRARRLGWHLKRLPARGPRGLTARYSLSLEPGNAFRASHLTFIAALIGEAEDRGRRAKS